MSAPEAIVDVSVVPQWDVVAPLRLLVLAAVRPHVKRAEDAEACAMVASELLENGVRYGDWRRDPGQRLRLAITAAGGMLIVAVASPVRERSDDLQALESHLARFSALPSRKDAYEGRIREILESTAPPSRSRMGLARIVAEAQGDIQARVDEAAVLHVTVHLAPGPAVPEASA